MTRASDVVVRLEKGKGRKPDSNGAPPDDRDAPDLPVIKIGPDLHRAVDATVAAISHDAELYQRDGALVRVVRVAEAEAKRERMAVGTPQIRPVSIATLRERATRMAKFVKYDKRSEDWVGTVPPDNVISAAAARGEWPGVRPLVGIIGTPSMRPDGSIIGTPGHDAATGYFYQPQREYPPIPDRPSLDDARRALGELLEPWREFPFRSEADRYVPVAAVATIVCRPAIPGAAPGFLVDGTVKGSGKSLIARTTTTLAQGRECALMTFPPKDEEAEKIFGAYALRAASVICFDNLTTPLGGGALDKVLTAADRVELRILGESEIPSLSWRAVVLFTGNNVVINGDTTRRVLVCRLEPKVERPEEEKHSFDLPAWSCENHPKLVAAALTLVRAYVVDGRKDQGLAGWGSFEAWRDLIGSAIVWAGGADVMVTRPTIAGEDDSETAALRVIVETWPMLTEDGLTVRGAMGALYPQLERGQERQADRYDTLREALETLVPPKHVGQPPNVVAVGKAFGRLRRRVVGGKYLDHVDRNVSPARWTVKEVS